MPWLEGVYVPPLSAPGPLSKLVDETDSKSVAVDPASRFESGEGHFTRPPHPAPLLGRPSRKAATAAIKAHLAVLRGEPLKGALSEALQEASGLGGQERRFAALATRELSRHQRLLDLAVKLLGGLPSGRALTEDQALMRYVLWRRLFTGAGWERIGAEVKLPGPVRPRSIKDDLLERLATGPLPEPEQPEVRWEREAMRHSLPGWLAQRLGALVPEAEVGPLFAALNAEPALIFRARPPGTRAERIAELAAEQLSAEPLPWAKDALILRDPGNRVFESRPMKQGKLQVQDLGSQLIVELCGGLAGATAVDFCAGAGGKTLALADRARRVIASDISHRRLGDARARVKRMRLANVTFAVPPRLEEAELILVDAPCSGVGSLAREPEQKWRLTVKAVEELRARQLGILREVGAGARSGAVIVYATCSLLREENEAVVEAFLAERPDIRLEPAAEHVGEAARALCEGPYLRVYPHRAAGGGFFAARMVKAPS